jgi:hypothetical protein
MNSVLRLRLAPPRFAECRQFDPAGLSRDQAIGYMSKFDAIAADRKPKLRMIDGCRVSDPLDYRLMLK